MFAQSRGLKLIRGNDLLWVAVVVSIGIACAPSPESAERAASSEVDVAAIKAQVDKYVQSIDAADITLAADVWLPSPDVSFINPRGQQNGWEAIQENFYGKGMGVTFSDRKLTTSDIAVHVFGGTAIAEFNWTFDATWRKDGTPMQSSGRESQVYNRTDDGRWTLVHVHYSGPPIVAERQGF